MVASVHFIAVLFLARRVPDLIQQMRGIVAAMTNNPDFPKPVPALDTVADHIDELEEAQKSAKTRTDGAVQERNTKEAVVRSDAKQLLAYVQGAADANRARAEAIINGARMRVRRSFRRQRQIFEAWCEQTSGEANLCAPAVKGTGVYEWEWSTDQQSWHALPKTLVSSTSVSGLTPFTVHYFRFRVMTQKEGQQDWSQPIALMVR